MDTPHHAKTPDAHEQQPAIIQLGAAAERPAEMVSAEELNMDIDVMLDRPGFAAFLENYSDAESLEVTDENKKEIAARFRAFEASQTVARQFELAMNQKLQADGKGRMNAEERQAYRDHVAELAAKEPEKLLELQEDLRALEEGPEKIRQKEAEFARLKKELDAETIKAGITELQGEKAPIKQSLKDSRKAEFSAWQMFLGSRGFGKAAQHLERQKQELAEFKEIEAAIQKAEATLASAPGEIARGERAVREAAEKLKGVQQAIFEENKAAKMIQKRLIAKTRKKCEEARQSMDIDVLQKAAEQFAADEKLAKAGSDYLGLDSDPDFAERHKQELHAQMELAIAVGIWKALESLPAGATQSRLERARRTFTRLTETEAGFAGREESKGFVLETLRQAEEDARTKSKGSGKSLLLKRLIAKLSKANTATT